jgi:hypothetical protein
VTDTIYRSSHPDVLAAWDKARDDEDAYNQRLATQMKAWGFDHTKIYVSSSAWGAPRLMAIVHHGELPTGWRNEGGRDSGRIVPYRKNKELAAQFDALVIMPSVRKALRSEGMPDHAFRSLSVTAPGISRRDDTVWVHWRDVEPEGVGDKWERVKLSDFYAMVEAGNDPFRSDAEEQS